MTLDELTRADERDGLDVYRAGRVARTVDPATIRLDPPGVILTDPKYPHNVGQALRVCSCYGVGHLAYSGHRVPIAPQAGYRLPREERMRGYGDVNLYQYDRPFELFTDACFIAVEVRDNAESLPWFEHPANAVYVFGPEDGSLGRVTLQRCHRFVVIPSKHCLNLANAVGTVLYDRTAKLARS